MREWCTCCCNEAANHRLPISAVFWIIWIVSTEECSSLMHNLIQIHCSTQSFWMWRPHSTHAHSTVSTAPLTSTAKLSLFIHVHSSPHSLAARLHRCCTNCSRYINNGWTFCGQTSYNNLCTEKNWCGSSWPQVMCFRNPRLSHQSWGAWKTKGGWVESRRLVIGTKQKPSHWNWGPRLRMDCQMTRASLHSSRACSISPANPYAIFPKGKPLSEFMVPYSPLQELWLSVLPSMTQQLLSCLHLSPALFLRSHGLTLSVSLVPSPPSWCQLGSW